MMRFLSTALTVFALTVFPAAAEVVKTIAWEDMEPAAPPLTDPMSGLTTEQSANLETIIWINDAKARNVPARELGEGVPDPAELAANLKKTGLDVDAMLARYADYKTEVKRRNQTPVNTLNGKMVRLPGYALPLDRSNKGVKEFLLVPYVGACIHVPPPPQNQIVYVRVEKPFELDDLYTPVWIIGRMQVKQVSKSLSFVDGSDDISAGYVIQNAKVEPYTE